MTLVGVKISGLIYQYISIKTEKSDDEMSEGIKIFDPKIIAENIIKEHHPQHVNKSPTALK